MNNSRILNLFHLRSKSAKGCIGALVLQQLVVASSTVWITLLIKRVSNGQDFWFYLLLYIGSLTFPYLPGGAALVLLQQWQQDMLARYLGEFVTWNRSRPSMWSIKTERDERISILSSESRQTLSQAAEYLYRVTASCLNVALNILVISLLVEKGFAFAYAISLAASALLFRSILSGQSRLAARAQDDRVAFTHELISAWDNVVLGNVHNFAIWKRSSERSLSEMTRSAIRLARFNQLVSVSIALLTLLPTVEVVIMSVMSHSGDKAALAAIIVTLPRLFMILTNTHDLLSLASQWNEQKTKLEGIFRAFSEKDIELDSRISWSKLRLHAGDTAATPSPGDLVHLLPAVGRVTIRGENGAGKSTLLTLIKKSFGDDAYYLPAQHALRFEADNARDFSTGQTLGNCLREIAMSVPCRVLLLDEWAANLDPENQEKLSSLIDELAQSRCVIEVRH